MGHSVNDEIDAENYPTEWGTAAEFADIVRHSFTSSLTFSVPARMHFASSSRLKARPSSRTLLMPSQASLLHHLTGLMFQIRAAPPGAQFATLDIEAAYRGIPCAPEHKRYLVIYHEGKLYIDHNIPFGLASATGLQGEVADATVHIWRALDVKPSKKWVDDVALFRFPSANGSFLGISNGEVYRFDYDLTHAKSLVAEAKVPWHELKGQPFADDGIYVGFLWDVPSKTVVLLERKCLKYIARLLSFLARYTDSRVPKRELEQIAGCLNHAAFCYPEGRSYLTSLFADMASYTTDFSPRYISRSTRTDLKWWLRTLSLAPTPLDLSPRLPTRDYNIWVDASTGTGISLVWNGQWAFWRTVAEWRGPSRDIAWLEAIAIELAITLIHQKGIKDADVLIHSDNQGVIAAFHKGRCSNYMINLAIRRSEVLMRESRLSLSLVYVHTSSNLADPISRGILPSASSRLTFPPSLPSDISPFFVL
jgi:hypothetical protein